MMVMFLDQIVDYYNLLQIDPLFVLTLQDIAVTIKDVMNVYLWDNISNDHFITQLNPDGINIFL